MAPFYNVSVAWCSQLDFAKAWFTTLQLHVGFLTFLMVLRVTLDNLLTFTTPNSMNCRQNNFFIVTYSDIVASPPNWVSTLRKKGYRNSTPRSAIWLFVIWYPYGRVLARMINMIIREKRVPLWKKRIICSNSTPEAPFWYPFFSECSHIPTICRYYSMD